MKTLILFISLFSCISNADIKFRQKDLVKLPQNFEWSDNYLFYNCDKVKKFEIKQMYVRGEEAYNNSCKNNEPSYVILATFPSKYANTCNIQMNFCESNLEKIK